MRALGRCVGEQWRRYQGMPFLKGQESVGAFMGLTLCMDVLIFIFSYTIKPSSFQHCLFHISHYKVENNNNYNSQS